MSAIRAGTGETITAVMNTPMPPGDEHYGAPLTIGFYDGCEEVWLQGQHGRVQIPVAHLAAVIKELRHAAQASKESGDE